MELEILYHDDNYIAINKPASLLVHRSPIDRHETQFAVQLLRDQIGQRVYPVHRLDKPTSGVLIFALNKDALRLLSTQFSTPKNDEIKKTYLAVVRGFINQSGVIEHPVKAKKDPYIDKPLKPLEAQTVYNCINQTTLPVCIDRYPTSRFSLVRLQPLTGRRHQLRYHMKHCSHPIIGDAKYGKGHYNRYFKEHLNCNRLLLAAVSLAFFHPFKNQIIQINADPGHDFRHACLHLGWSVPEKGI